MICITVSREELQKISTGKEGKIQTKTIPSDTDNVKETVTTGLLNLIGDLLCQEDDGGYTPRPLTEMDKWEKERLEKILGRRISAEAFICYCTREEYEQQSGLAYSL